MRHFLPVYHLGIVFLGRVEDQNITCGEVADFSESDETIKISASVDKSNTYDGFSCNILSLFKSEEVLE